MVRDQHKWIEFYPSIPLFGPNIWNFGLFGRREIFVDIKMTCKCIFVKNASKIEVYFTFISYVFSYDIYKPRFLKQ